MQHVDRHLVSSTVFFATGDGVGISAESCRCSGTATEEARLVRLLAHELEHWVVLDELSECVGVGSARSAALDVRHEGRRVGQVRIPGLLEEQFLRVNIACPTANVDLSRQIDELQVLVLINVHVDDGHRRRRRRWHLLLKLFIGGEYFGLLLLKGTRGSLSLSSCRLFLALRRR